MGVVLRPMCPIRKRKRLQYETLERRDLLASISGTHFSDQNRNGIQDPGEPGLVGARVELSFDDFGFVQFLAETTTDGSGRFQFDGLDAGNYQVRADTPSPFQASGPNLLRRTVDEVAGFANPGSVGAGFFDGDLQPEIFVLQPDSPSSRIAILRDDGTSLQVVTNVLAQPDAQSFLVADLNDDQFADFAVSSGGGDVEVFLNDTQGGYAVPQTLTVGSLPRGLVAHDFDGDNDLDLAVVNNQDSTVSVLVNDGSGVFSAGTTVAAGPGPEEIAAGDFDLDGRIDLVVANLGNAQNDGGISILTNTTTAPDSITFSTPEILDLDATVIEVVADRFFDSNQDGQVDAQDRPDIVIVKFESRTLELLDGATRAVRQTVELRKAGQAPLLEFNTGTSITQGDFDGDGDLDVALAATTEPEVIFLPNQNTTHFTDPVRSGFLGQFSTTTRSVVTSADLDLDGDLDFVVAEQRPSPAAGTIHLVRSDFAAFDARVTLIADDEVVDGISLAAEAPPMVVNSLGDGGDTNLNDGVPMAADGTVTLRAAIEQANANQDDGITEIIEFDLSGSGPHVIPLTTGLPMITDPLIIDARPSPLYRGSPVIQIDGRGILATGLIFHADAAGSQVRAVGLTRFVDSGIRLEEGPSNDSQAEIEFATGNMVARFGNEILFDSAVSDVGPIRLISSTGGVTLVDAAAAGITGTLTLSPSTGRTLRLDGLDQSLDLIALADVALRGIKAIDLSAVTDHQLILDDSEAAHLANTDVLRLISDTDDQIEVGAGFTFDSVTLEQGRLVHRFEGDLSAILFEGPRDFTNPIHSFDVNGLFGVTAGDALSVINELARRRFSDDEQFLIAPESADLDLFQFYDVNRDGRITALDALQVINELARIANGSGAGGEGEWATLAPTHATSDPAVSSGIASAAGRDNEPPIQKASRRLVGFDGAGWLDQKCPSDSLSPWREKAERDSAESVDAVWQQLGHPPDSTDVDTRSIIR